MMATDGVLAAILERLARLEASEAQVREENRFLRARLEQIEERPPLPTFLASASNCGPLGHPINPLDTSDPPTSTASSSALSATSRPVKNDLATAGSAAASSCTSPLQEDGDAPRFTQAPRPCLPKPISQMTPIPSAAMVRLAENTRQDIYLSPSVDALPSSLSPPPVSSSMPPESHHEMHTISPAAAKEDLFVSPPLAAAVPPDLGQSPPEFALVGFGTTHDVGVTAPPAALTEGLVRGHTPRFHAAKEADSPLSRLTRTMGTVCGQTQSSVSASDGTVSSRRAAGVAAPRPQPRNNLPAELSPFSHSLSVKDSSTLDADKSLSFPAASHKRISISSGMTVESVSRTLIQEMAKIMMDTQRLDKESRETAKRLRQETQSRRTTAKKLVYKLSELTEVVWSVYERIGAVEEAVFGDIQVEETYEGGEEEADLVDGGEEDEEEEDDECLSTTTGDVGEPSTTRVGTRVSGRAHRRRHDSADVSSGAYPSNDNEADDEEGVHCAALPLSPVSPQHPNPPRGARQGPPVMRSHRVNATASSSSSSGSHTQEGVQQLNMSRRSRHTTTVSGVVHTTTASSSSAGDVAQRAPRTAASGMAAVAASPGYRGRNRNDTHRTNAMEGDDEDRPAMLDTRASAALAAAASSGGKKPARRTHRRLSSEKKHAPPTTRLAKRTNSQRLVPMKVGLGSAGKSFSLQSSAGNSLFVSPNADRTNVSHMSEWSSVASGTPPTLAEQALPSGVRALEASRRPSLIRTAMERQSPEPDTSLEGRLRSSGHDSGREVALEPSRSATPPPARESGSEAAHSLNTEHRAGVSDGVMSGASSTATGSLTLHTNSTSGGGSGVGSAGLVPGGGVARLPIHEMLSPTTRFRSKRVSAHSGAASRTGAGAGGSTAVLNRSMHTSSGWSSANSSPRPSPPLVSLTHNESRTSASSSAAAAAGPVTSTQSVTLTRQAAPPVVSVPSHVHLLPPLNGGTSASTAMTTATTTRNTSASASTSSRSSHSSPAVAPTQTDRDTPRTTSTALRHGLAALNSSPPPSVLAQSASPAREAAASSEPSKQAPTTRTASASTATTTHSPLTGPNPPPARTANTSLPSRSNSTSSGVISSSRFAPSAEAVWACAAVVAATPAVPTPHSPSPPPLSNHYVITPLAPAVNSGGGGGISGHAQGTSTPQKEQSHGSQEASSPRRVEHALLTSSRQSSPAATARTSTSFASAPIGATTKRSSLEPSSPLGAPKSISSYRRPSSSNGTASGNSSYSAGGCGGVGFVGDALRLHRRPSHKVGGTPASPSSPAASGAVIGSAQSSFTVPRYENVAVASTADGSSCQESHNRPLIALMEVSCGQSYTTAAAAAVSTPTAALAPTRDASDTPQHESQKVHTASTTPPAGRPPLEQIPASNFQKDTDMCHGLDEERHSEEQGPSAPSSALGGGRFSTTPTSVQSVPPLSAMSGLHVVSPPGLSLQQAPHVPEPQPQTLVEVSPGASSCGSRDGVLSSVAMKSSATPLTSCLVTSVPTMLSSASVQTTAGGASHSRAPPLMSAMIDAEGLPLEGCEASVSAVSQHRVSITAPSPTEIDRDRRKRKEQALSQALLNKMLHHDT